MEFLHRLEIAHCDLSLEIPGVDDFNLKIEDSLLYNLEINLLLAHLID